MFSRFLLLRVLLPFDFRPPFKEAVEVVEVARGIWPLGGGVVNRVKHFWLLDILVRSSHTVGISP